MLTGCINTLLHDTATMLVAGNLCTLSCHGFEEERLLGTVPAVENLLDYMITIDVFAHLFDTVLQVIGDDLEMFLGLSHLDDLLH